MELVLALGILAGVGGVVAWGTHGSPRRWARACVALGLRAVPTAWRLEGDALAPAGWEPPTLAGHGTAPTIGRLEGAHEGRRLDRDVLVARELGARAGWAPLYVALTEPETWWWSQGTAEDGQLPLSARGAAEELLALELEVVLVHGGVVAVRGRPGGAPDDELLTATAALAAALQPDDRDWPLAPRASGTIDA